MLFEIGGERYPYTIEAAAAVFAVVAVRQMGIGRDLRIVDGLTLWNVSDNCEAWPAFSEWESKYLDRRFERDFGTSFYDVMWFHWRPVLRAIDSLVIGRAGDRAAVLAQGGPKSAYRRGYHSEATWGPNLWIKTRPLMAALFRGCRGTRDELEEVLSGKS